MIMLERLTNSQRGEISLLAIEIKPGVFVANINARVREKLWQKICMKWDLDALMVYSSNNEQGYQILSNGDPSREVIDLDGITLLARTCRRKNDNS